jgi:hypothetical protein
MAAHRYWRWISHFPANLTAISYAVCGNIKYYDATDTEITGGTMSASGEFSGSYPASASRNGNTTSYWCSPVGYASAHNAWLQVDFGAGNAKDVRKFSIQTCHDSSANQCAAFHEMQYSDDGTNFTTVRRFSNGTWTVSQTRTFDLSPNVTDTAPFWRILIKAAGTNNWAEVAEIVWTNAALSAVTGGTDLTNTAWDLTTYVASKARDGNPATYWASANQVNSKVNAVLGVDWGASSHKMAKVSITPRSPTYENAPSVFFVENSVDGIGWDQVGSAYTHTWINTTTQTFDIDAGGPGPGPSGSRRRPVIVCS